MVGPARRVLISTLPALFLTAAFWFYREQTTGELAAPYPPVSVTITLVPPGTSIHASLRDGIAESARPGDIVPAFVSVPVRVNHAVTIPIGAQVSGRLEQISMKEAKAIVRLNFDVLAIEGRRFSIQAMPVIAETPVKSDLEVLASALAAVVGAGIGTAIAAQSKNERALAVGLAGGSMRSTRGRAELSTPVTLVLIRPLSIRR